MIGYLAVTVQKNMDAATLVAGSGPVARPRVQICSTGDSRAMCEMMGMESCGLRQNPLLRDRGSTVGAGEDPTRRGDRR